MQATVGTWLHEATQMLQQAGVGTARLDCLVLLEDALHKNRAGLLAHPETIIAHGQLAKLNNFIIQRKKLLPLAYIRGKAEFYGREFAVNTHALVPRPESEALIDICKALELPPRARIADVGTGSGCLGVTAARELRGSHVSLYDISHRALAVARRNARTHDASVVCEVSDLLQLEHKTDIIFDVVLANLPYVPNDYPIDQAALHEPGVALFGGQNGLDVYRRFWQQITALTHRPRHIIAESLPEQHNAHTLLACAAGYYFAGSQDFAQHFEISA